MPTLVQYSDGMEFDFDELEARALLCAEATIAGPQLRELLRLAKLGAAMENEGLSLYSFNEFPTFH
jgi:hypothetical protein